MGNGVSSVAFNCEVDVPKSKEFTGTRSTDKRHSEIGMWEEFQHELKGSIDKKHSEIGVWEEFQHELKGSIDKKHSEIRMWEEFQHELKG
ncbi:hypothetical protein Goshw_017811 [Gossypium schwendimanii]|uniref:Uncharacterized protein n=1 Tax=Gossypium schwendimanii TaxID=34291 RepID=A0A7J9MX14_GOSSC|nr:hypothetical protein [Gossypium schwendimanii]